ncbi:hypothetical protein [Dactylosporangium fulvum]|uniref:Tissue inhibitor of metalloproteinase n=1 Tax=Dactylosporangium fulvum TaxID=53359 RepID=A0ABY5VN13_9ACTN|nr:hypothetical protein [Dactylosporangium fulvum]UWP79112.1 hypothetical protein Dfulv_28535 [Dactylosporangium fulvum]
MLRRIVVVVVIGLLAVLAGPVSPACACSCAIATEQEYLDRATFVFDGDVRSIDRLDSAPGDFPLAVRLVVRAVHKGQVVDPGGHILVGDPDNEASCGYAFETGRRYRVYVREQGPRFVTSLCAGNRELGPATTDDAAWSAEPASPVAGTLPRDDRTSVITLMLFAVVAAGTVAVVIAVLRHRRLARPGGTARDR